MALNTLNKLMPIEGCCVAPKDCEDIKSWFTVISSNGEEIKIKGRDGKILIKKTEELIPRFAAGMHVKDMPASITRKSFGNGIVLRTRCVGDSHQVLVEFKEAGKILWMPYENLKLINDITTLFSRKTEFTADDAERVRLKNLSYAIELWNENTGALTHIDIDPLPHQIHLVHKIISSGNYNWMIADDVGLGKTIEIGMLIKALMTKRFLRKVLIVCPGGLTRQWQSELKEKFKIADFRIFGDDFKIHDDGHWKKEDFVIASIDKIKREENLESLSKAGFWDLVVFDEAHRLSRRQYGLKYEASERFKVAAMLRKHTEHIILATATPHQGEPSKFQALLEILRPDLQSEFKNLNKNYGVLNQLIIRNDKSKVTDNEGKLIFKGKDTHLVDVEVSDLEKAFDQSLQKYLREGYNMSINKGNAARAIGFVMNTYRKLAASSIMAIRNALQRRMNKLHESNKLSNLDLEDDWEELSPELNDEIALKDIENAEEFFEGEIELLEELVLKAEKILESEDNKIEQFIGTILNKILNHNDSEKVLIFTEYRATQEYIQNALSKRFGENKVGLINGSLSQSERIKVIEDFDKDLQFLVSTEAGGEGINLQKNCHIVVNFDLPWNPMRLVQRIGRVYRYGQNKKVIVFNIQSAQTFDSHILSKLYERIHLICSDLSNVSGFEDNLEDEVLGILSENIDVEEIITKNRDYKSSRTEEEIFEAISKAKEAAEKQKEIFKTFSSYDPDEFKDELKLEKAHIKSFVFGMLDLLKIDYKQGSSKKIFDIELNEELSNEYRKQKLKISFSKDYFDSDSVEVIDYNSKILLYLISKAKANIFHDGICFVNSPYKAISTAILRWQNDQGKRQKEEFVSVSVDEKNKRTLNCSEFSDWLLYKNSGNVLHTKMQDEQDTRQILNIFREELEKRLSKLQNNSLFPENFEYISLNWS